jgi:hypothetical protein
MLADYKINGKDFRGQSQSRRSAISEAAIPLLFPFARCRGGL